MDKTSSEVGGPAKTKTDKQFDDRLFNLLQNEDFRDYIWHLLERGQMFQTTFTGNSNGFFQEGGRNSALMILDEINQSDPDAFIKMMQKSTHKNKD